MRVKKPLTQDFQFIAGNLALDFVNTVGNRLGTSREYLSSAEELNRWARLAKVIPQRPVLTLNRRGLGVIRGVREELYRLFLPLASGSRLSTSRLARLNERWGKTASKRLLVLSTKNVNWAWDAASDDPDRVLGPVLLSATELLVEGLSRKIRQCEGERCGWLFLDRSRSGHRRWCSMADCGNRAKASRHYWKMKDRKV
jgi:predicted RNA-binding Zn ribbon-like protein